MQSRTKHFHLLSTTPTPKPTPTNNTNKGKSVWEKLRAPTIFGVGLYLGLVVFGNSKDKEEAAIFTEMKSLFYLGKR
jgi:hypothetical protein